MMAATPAQMRLIADKLDALAGNIKGEMARSLAYHGARIERDAKILTPVDTGALMGANQYRVEIAPDGAVLTVANRMVYAHYQHANKLNHRNKPTARDHFIEIPFEAEIPRITADIRDIIIKEATE